MRNTIWRCRTCQNARCRIFAIDEMTCYQACIYLDTCWSQEEQKTFGWRKHHRAACRAQSCKVVSRIRGCRHPNHRLPTTIILGIISGRFRVLPRYCSIDWPASDRNAGRNEIGTGGRLRFGISGRLQRNTHKYLLDIIRYVRKCSG